MENCLNQNKQDLELAQMNSLLQKEKIEQLESSLKEQTQFNEHMEQDKNELIARVNEQLSEIEKLKNANTEVVEKLGQSQSNLPEIEFFKSIITELEDHFNQSVI